MKLTSTAEGIFLLSACELVLDRRASLPAAVLRTLLSGEGPEALIDERVGEETLRREGDDREGIPWESDPLLAGLRDLAEEGRYLSPSELLDRVIETSGLRDLCRRWGGAEFRLSNVEMFRSYAAQYEEYCGFRGRGASFLGLYLYLLDLDDGGKQSAATSPETIDILTYHKAKGREWPVVIIGDPEKSGKDRVLASNPRAFSSPGAFDPRDPLKGRYIRFWPWPYGATVTNAPLWGPLNASDLEITLSQLEEREEQRLMYVGITRARDVLIIPSRLKKKKGNPSPERFKSLGAGVAFPVNEEEGTFESDFGLKESFSVRLRLIDIEENTEIFRDRTLNRFARPGGEAPAHGDLFMKASDLQAEEGARVTEEHSLGQRLPGNFKGDADDPSFGNAVHAFFAADGKDLKQGEREALAGRILEAHGKSGVLAAGALVEASDRLRAFIESRWPGARVLKELPLQHNRSGQMILGVADLVVETGQELVLIDHKSYPGGAEQCRQRALEYAGQLRAYAEALERAAGKRCATRAIHYPVQGLIVGVG